MMFPVPVTFMFVICKFNEKTFITGLETNNCRVSRSMCMLAHDLAGNDNGLKYECRQTYAETHNGLSAVGKM